MPKRITITGLVGLYLSAVVAANLIVTHFGPAASIYTAFALIGADLCSRDALASWWGTTRWQKMGLLIGAGSLISYLANHDAATIAIASTVAFATSETCEAVLYHLVRARPWVERANIAAILAALIDSAVFTTLAFGFSWQIAAGQTFAKLAGCLCWSFLLVALIPERRGNPARATS